MINPPTNLNPTIDGPEFGLTDFTGTPQTTPFSPISTDTFNPQENNLNINPSVPGGDNFRGAAAPPGGAAPPGTDDPSVAEGRAILASLSAAAAQGAGNGSPLVQLAKWMNLVGMGDEAVSKIEASVVNAISQAIKAIANEILSAVKAIIGQAKGFVEFWKDEQMSFFKALKLLYELAKGAT